MEGTEFFWAGGYVRVPESDTKRDAEKRGGVSGVLRIGKCGSLKEGIWKVLGAGKTGVGRRCRGERGGMVVGSKDGDGGFPQGEERPGGYI